MNVLGLPIAGLPRRVGGRVPGRSLLAASFVWLVVLSLIAALVMFRVSDPLLLPVGLIAFLGFPKLVGLGLFFTPNWAQPAVGICARLRRGIIARERRETP